MSDREERYGVTLNTRLTGILKCGELIVRELDGRVVGIGFKYDESYVEHSQGFSIDPIAVPLRRTAYQFYISDKFPGFLDDYLPDSWGKKVLARAATVSKKIDFNANSLIDILSLVSKSNIGALSIHPKGESASYDLGLDMSELSDAEKAAQLILDPNAKMELETAKLIHLWREGSGGAGGARPKSLVHKNNRGYLAKYNQSTDTFNNVKVELACLRMANEAGINVSPGLVEQGFTNFDAVSGLKKRDILLLDRFDIDGGLRKHLISINSMLKSPKSFADIGVMFKYDTIHSVLQKHSENIEEDVEQLFRMMLFNRVINNVDDHERNFSLINDGNGYRFSPAYDMVPCLTRGEYHAAGYKYSNSPLSPFEVKGDKSVFGVSKLK
ncbi:MAG: type II toxin-antitoxin system HipA family toxin, partial [Kangiellaceae bacterium]|nr:type II toxin-antitoxin system HipA family toxin [Kangiellaceae bacterium]